MLAIHKGHGVKIVVPVEHDKRVLSRLQLFRNVNLVEPAIEDLLGHCTYREIQNGEPLLSTDKENHTSLSWPEAVARLYWGGMA